MTIPIRHYQKREVTDQRTTLPLPPEGRQTMPKQCMRAEQTLMSRQAGIEDTDGLGSSQEEKIATEGAPA